MRWHDIGILGVVLLLGDPAPAAEKPATDKGGNRWAVLIGVDNYAELGKLRYAGNDQRALAERLIASGFAHDQVFLLHDKAEDRKYLPVRENIEKQLDLVLGQLAGQGDLVIVGFSGHGVQLEGKSYLCPLDARLDKLAGTVIPLDGVYERLTKSKAALKLFLVDACRNDVVPAGRRSIAMSRGLGEFAGAQERPPEGILLLASCGPGQISMEDEAFGHGVFMHYVLEGLSGKAANHAGMVSLARLYDYASFETKKYVARKFNDYQTPALKGEINGPFEICSLLPSHPTPGPATPPSPSPSPSRSEVVGKTFTNSIEMKLTLIPAGEFQMGSSESVEDTLKAFEAYEPKATWFTPEHPKHKVRITKAFYMGTCEVTVGQFRHFVEATNYKTDAEKDGMGGWGYDGDAKTSQKPEYNWRNTGFPQTDEHPVVNVSWNDAVAFCEWLSRKEGKTYRLPTEAEWEYACRAGTTTRYYHGDDPETLPEVGNVSDATLKEKFPNGKGMIRASDGYAFAAPVGKFRPNAFGLYDMHGNVCEWCVDWYGKEYYSTSPSDDPNGSDSGIFRVRRGGSWVSGPDGSRSAVRLRDFPDGRDFLAGFRVARTN